MTDNHDYTTPSEGTTNWDVPLNDNFRAIDTDVEIRDTDANKSNYQPKTGAKFMATDTGTIYLGDGSKWQSIGTLARLDGNIYVGSSEPSNPTENDIWIDTS